MAAVHRRLHFDAGPLWREGHVVAPNPRVTLPGDLHDPDASSSLLSNRESEIVTLVVQGLSNKEIARTLDISHWTVSSHLRRVFTKLEVNRRIELCRFVEEALR
jgi:DNA-binding NarL/FixJ family response regulator